MRIYTKYIEIPEVDDIIYDNDNDIKGKITNDYCEVYEVTWDNGDCEEYEFDTLTWDTKHQWWEI